MGSFGKCKYCLEQKELIKAHIIPASFFKLVGTNDPKNPGKIYDPTPGKFPKISRIGEYDNNMLCLSCEDIFGTWDNYAATILITDFASGKFKKVDLRSKRFFYTLSDYDYVKIKLFFLSVLWRAHASSRPFFDNVDLGPHANKIKQMLMDEDAGSSQDYSVYLVRYYDDLGNGSMCSPQLRKLDGLNVMQISLGPYTAFVKVDSQAYSNEYIECCIKQSQLNILMLKLRDDLNALSSMRKAIS